MLLLACHHSRPQLRELRPTSMGKNGWQKWGGNGTSSGAWQWDWSAAGADGQNKAKFSKYNTMQVAGGGQSSNTNGLAVEADGESSSAQLKQVQKLINFVRKSETQRQKIQDTRKLRAEQWNLFQAELKRAFVEQKQAFHVDIQKLDVEQMEASQQRDKALTDLKALIGGKATMVKPRVDPAAVQMTADDAKCWESLIQGGDTHKETFAMTEACAVRAIRSPYRTSRRPSSTLGFCRRSLPRPLRRGLRPVLLRGPRHRLPLCEWIPVLRQRASHHRVSAGPCAPSTRSTTWTLPSSTPTRLRRQAMGSSRRAPTSRRPRLRARMAQMGACLLPRREEFREGECQSAGENGRQASPASYRVSSHYLCSEGPGQARSPSAIHQGAQSHPHHGRRRSRGEASRRRTHITKMTLTPWTVAFHGFAACNSEDLGFSLPVGVFREDVLLLLYRDIFPCGLGAVPRTDRTFCVVGDGMVLDCEACQFCSLRYAPACASGSSFISACRRHLIVDDVAPGMRFEMVLILGIGQVRTLRITPKAPVLPCDPGALVCHFGVDNFTVAGCWADLLQHFRLERHCAFFFSACRRLCCTARRTGAEGDLHYRANLSISAVTPLCGDPAHRHAPLVSFADPCISGSGLSLYGFMLSCLISMEELCIAFGLSFMAMMTASILRLGFYATPLKGGIHNADPLLSSGRSVLRGAPLAFLFTAWLLLPAVVAMPTAPHDDYHRQLSDIFSRLEQADVMAQQVQNHLDHIVEHSRGSRSPSSDSRSA